MLYLTAGQGFGGFSEELASLYSSGRRVLEVGCSNGAMLHLWKSDWLKSGIEPSLSSAKEATRYGINIVGSSIDSLDHGQFDFIISVDTIEHIIDPLSYFATAKKNLAPRGVIITLSGDMSYDLARLAGPRYWYSSFPEHASFLLPPTYEHIARKLNGCMLFSRCYLQDDLTSRVAFCS